MASVIMPYAARLLSSEGVKHFKRHVSGLKRTISGTPPTLDIFLRLDDPYSYLLIQVLEPLLSRFKVTAHFHTVLELQSDMFPAMDMWYQYASRDAFHLAKLYDLDFPSAETVLKDKTTLAAATALLLEAEQQGNYLKCAPTVFKQVWAGSFDPEAIPVAADENTIKKQLSQNHALLKNKGHYFGAMIHFESEWYWGIDRLDHLEQRLIDQGLADSPDEQVIFNRTYKDFCATKKSTGTHSQNPLIIYWSARSPYSYLGLVRAIQLTQHYQIPLIIKPVLPMMMRGLNVPQVKKMYIFLDTKREAQKLGLPYGFVADPLGPAVERCYALLDYARNENKLQDFLLSFARAVNSEGIRAETDTGMKVIVERCGLNWPTAKQQLNNDQWKSEVDSNLNEMYQHGCWGVPSFCYGDQTFWGQDRLGMIEKSIQTS